MLRATAVQMTTFEIVNDIRKSIACLGASLDTLSLQIFEISEIYRGSHPTLACVFSRGEGEMSEVFFPDEQQKPDGSITFVAEISKILQKWTGRFTRDILPSTQIENG